MSADDPSFDGPERDFEDLYENAPCGYVSMLPDGSICRVNRTLLSMTGYAIDAVLGKPLRDFLPMAGRMFYETHFMPLLRLQGYCNEVALDLVKADGTRLQALANATLLKDGSEQPKLIRLIVLPATDRRRFERRLVQAQETLDEKVKALEQTSELREQFVSVLGHDLRNPLASIDSGVRMLSRTATDRDLKVLGLMRGSVSRMAALIDDVMDFARSRLGGGIGVELTDTDQLEAVLRQVVAELAVSHVDREIIVDIAFAGVVHCDASRIGQMVSNLLGNALTHGSKTEEVRLHASDTGGRLTINVVNGGFIPPEKLDRLFQPFIRGDTSGAKEGLGLGLFIASEIAKAHQGSLTATSIDGETRFVFRLDHRA
jgi:sigma-B regulation protein RsbU (phosphoserine phosphatase)